MALKFNAFAVYAHQNLQFDCRTHSFKLNFKPKVCQTAFKVSCSMNMAAGQSDDPRKLTLCTLMDKARSMWDSAPQPVKSFPWNKASDNFIQLILDLFLTVVKYLSIPVFAITSVSEMSYCAHERRLYIVPLPFLIGVGVAGVLKNAALESSPYLKNAEVPWHLIAIMAFFALLKFPGPYYTYWGRIFIPHIANGALLRTLWLTLLWYRKPQKTSDETTDSTVTIPEQGMA